MERAAGLGELALLKEVFLPDVSDAPDQRGDDCAHLELPTSRLLWSVDPCPTPVAEWLGLCSPEVLGWYTATINLSDIAACGGTPLSMLVALEFPGDTSIEFLRRFQRGLVSALRQHNTTLRGGNIKSARRFSAVGTIVGVPGSRDVTRTIDESECLIYVVGPCGRFWTSVILEAKGGNEEVGPLRQALRESLLYPKPQTAAGRLLGGLPFQVACMDCSDGVANALQQLAARNNLDLVVDDAPAWNLSADIVSALRQHKIQVENACYSFGDWQLVCLVPAAEQRYFESCFATYDIVNLGRTQRGSGKVCKQSGRLLSPSSLNENFNGGYNSIESVDELIDRFMHQAIFV